MADPAETPPLMDETLPQDQSMPQESSSLAEHADYAQPETFDERLARVKQRRQSRQYSYVQRASRQRVGCALSTLSVLTVTLALVVLAFFLPPISDLNPVIRAIEEERSGDFTLLSAAAPRAEIQGLGLEVRPDAPGEDFGVAVWTAEAAAYQQGEVPSQQWRCPPASSIPPFLEVKSPLYSLALTGSAPEGLGLRVPLPAQDIAFADLYGWYPRAAEWRFMPAQRAADASALLTHTAALPDCLAVMEALPTVPVLATTLAPQQELDAALMENFSRLYLAGMQPLPNGDLAGSLPLLEDSTAAAYRPFLLLQNVASPGVSDLGTVLAILQSAESRQQHSSKIAESAAAGDYAGIVLDYQGLSALPPAQLPLVQHQFSDLVRLIAEKLHAQDQQLLVRVPPARLHEGVWSTGVYDWRSIGDFADELIVQLPVDPRAYLPQGEATAMLAWAVGEVNRTKLHIALTALDVETSPGGARPLLPAAAENPGSSPAAVVQVDEHPALQLSSRSFFVEGVLQRSHWATSPAALLQRMALAGQFHLGGIVLEDAHSVGARSAETLQRYIETENE